MRPLQEEIPSENDLDEKERKCEEIKALINLHLKFLENRGKDKEKELQEIAKTLGEGDVQKDFESDQIETPFSQSTELSGEFEEKLEVKDEIVAQERLRLLETIDKLEEISSTTAIQIVTIKSEVLKLVTEKESTLQQNQELYQENLSLKHQLACLQSEGVDQENQTNLEFDSEVPIDDLKLELETLRKTFEAERATFNQQISEAEEEKKELEGLVEALENQVALLNEDADEYREKIEEYEARFLEMKLERDSDVD
jgi:hypothetical protein